jgi:hypothetical protein
MGRSPADEQVSGTEENAMTQLGPPARVPLSLRQRFQIFDNILRFLCRETKAEAGVIVTYDIGQGWETTVMVEAALHVSPQTVQRRRSVRMIRRDSLGNHPRRLRKVCTFQPGSVNVGWT